MSQTATDLVLDVGLLVLVQVDLVEPRPVEPHALPLAHDLGGVDLKDGSSLRFCMHDRD